MSVENMYCFQCEQVAGGEACTRMGVCGKDPEVSGLQDLVIHQMMGIGVLGARAMERGVEIPEDISSLVEEATFETLTNVDFDPDRFHRLLEEGDAAKERLLEMVGDRQKVGFLKGLSENLETDGKVVRRETARN